MAETVGQIGADGGGDAGAQAPACQGWYGYGAATGVEDGHAGRQDEPVHGERDEPGGCASLAVRGDEFVGVPVGDDGSDRGDGGHGQGGSFTQARRIFSNAEPMSVPP
jgi:hypothetical protein